MEKEKPKMITTAIIDHDGFKAMKELIGKLGNFDFHGVYWAYNKDDMYFGIAPKPFDDEKLKEWAEMIKDKEFQIADDDDISVDDIIKNVKVIKPRD